MTVTTLTEQNRTLVQGMYKAAMSQDVDGVMSCLADDVVVHEPSFLPYGATYHGKQGFGELFAKIAESLDLTTLALDYLVADGDKVFGVLRGAEIGSGREVLLAEESTIRNGRVAQMKIFFHEAQSLITVKQ